MTVEGISLNSKDFTRLKTIWHNKDFNEKVFAETDYAPSGV